MTNGLPTTETTDDALTALDDLDGRDIIDAELARDIAAAFGVTDIESIVHPLDYHLPFQDDATPGVAVNDLAAAIVEDLGGERPTSQLIGAGSSADDELQQALPEIRERLETQTETQTEMEAADE